MRSLVTIAWLFTALPALAQDAPGLDLTQPPKPKQGGDTTELPPIDLSKPAEPPEKATPPDEKPEARPVAPFSEKDVALGDKVKAVQRKGFLKRGRFEVTPVFAVTVNDAFYQKFGGGLRLAYNVRDSFAVAGRFVTYRKPELSDPRSWEPSPIRTDNGRAGKIAFDGQLLQSQIYDQLMLGGIWSPVYGKISFREKQIIHFDLFLSAGLGIVWTATSEGDAERDRFEHPDRSGISRYWNYSKLATDLGGGVRFYPKEWMAFELGMTATLYPDQPVAGLPSSVQKVFVANVGVSFFFPRTFDYIYP
jgi:outer membrane beta-barrel protein